MSLSTTIASAVKQAFDALGDQVGDVIITKPGTYDPQTGTYGTGSDDTFTGVFVDVMNSTFKNSGVGLGHQVCFMLPDVTNSDPEIGDSLVGVAGVKWTIVDRIKYQPYNDNFLWELLVKA